MALVSRKGFHCSSHPAYLYRFGQGPAEGARCRKAWGQPLCLGSKVCEERVPSRSVSSSFPLQRLREHVAPPDRGCTVIKHARCLQSRKSVENLPKGKRQAVIVHAFPPIRDEEAGRDPGKFMVDLERAWHISKRPKPVPCSTCSAAGEVDCPWCRGTGFLVLGDTMVCDVHDHDRSCKVCHGTGSINCDDCKGTGKRAGWMERVPPHDSDERFRFPR